MLEAVKSCGALSKDDIAYEIKYGYQKKIILMTGWLDSDKAKAEDMKEGSASRIELDAKISVKGAKIKEMEAVIGYADNLLNQ